MNCPRCRAPLEAHKPGGAVEVDHCPACYGAFFDAGELRVSLDKGTAKPAPALKCPRCAAGMETLSVYDGMLELERCLGCRGFWFDAGELQALRRLSGIEQLVGEPDEPEAEEKKPARSAPRGGGKKAASEQPPAPPEMSRQNNPDEYAAPVVKLEGRSYEHFQTSMPVTTHVLGEFPWVAKVGDIARMRDFVSPPFLLSNEVSDDESIWTKGEYVQPEEVWEAFKRPGAPLRPIGVGPAQPNPWSEQLGAVWTRFVLAAGVCVAAYMFASAGAQEKTVLDQQFELIAGQPERSRVSGIFELGGRTSNLEVSIGTNLDQQWAGFSMALINEDTGAALDFGMDVSYYHGYEDGEAWREGRPYGTAYLPRVPPGRYYLRIEPETDRPHLVYGVRLRRDVPLKRVPLLAVGLLLFFPVFMSIRSGSFEAQRWAESDHPRSGSGGEDDE